MFNEYLNSFPEEKRQYYNCNCCRQFLNNYGSIVSIINNKIVSLWDFEIDGIYEEIPKRLSKLVKEATIKNFFISKERKLGTDYNYQLLEGNISKKWEHFYLVLPKEKNNFCIVIFTSLGTEIQ